MITNGLNPMDYLNHWPNGLTKSKKQENLNTL